LYISSSIDISSATLGANFPNVSTNFTAFQIVPFLLVFIMYLFYFNVKLLTAVTTYQAEKLVVGLTVVAANVTTYLNSTR
jgi:hypothetical protein